MENTNTFIPHENASASSDVHSTSVSNLFDRLLSSVIQCFQTFVSNLFDCLPIIPSEENVLTSIPNDNGNPSYQDYDVFINHRGPDIKATFATELYSRLVDCGFKVFLDDPEMQVGEPIAGQIKLAIETASIHVAVFSPSYAESTWCLEELKHMLMMHQSRDSTIIPVFYEVDPSALRSTSSDYAKALQEKKKRFNNRTIKKWRKALKRVSHLRGFELNGDDDELVREVVVHALESREKRRLKYVAPYAHEFRRTLESCQAKFVGIVGPAGVGKTTLANEFFQSNKSGYSASCFLFDVKQNTTDGSLISMQRKLLKDLTPSDQQMGTIGTVEEGREELKKLISKVLIILDNVDHPDQIYKVLPMQDVNGSSSLILVTSRDKNVFESDVFERRITEVSIYNLTGLKTVHPRTNLRTNLILGGCWLKELPSWLGQLTSLKELWLRDSPNLKKFLWPRDSYQLLNRLERLTIMACGIQTLLPDLVNMNNLTDLRVHDCPLDELSFRKVPEKAILARESRRLGGEGGSGASQNVYPKLKRLWINSCRDLVKVSSLPTTLITLDFSNCNRLIQIDGLWHLERLEKLDISGCEKIKELQPLGLLKSLKELKAFRCSKLKRIQGLADTLRLQIINVRQCHEINEMPGVERLLSLKTLDVCGCPKMRWGPEVFAQLQQQLKDDFLYDSN